MGVSSNWSRKNDALIALHILKQRHFGAALVPAALWTQSSFFRPPEPQQQHRGDSEIVSLGNLHIDAENSARLQLHPGRSSRRWIPTRAAAPTNFYRAPNAHGASAEMVQLSAAPRVAEVEAAAENSHRIQWTHKQIQGAPPGSAALSSVHYFPLWF